MNRDSDHYEGPNRRGWHVKREVSLGDLVAITVCLVSAFSAYAAIDKRVSLLEQGRAEQGKLDERQDSEAMRYQARIDKSLADISHKLDRILEGRR